VRSIGRVPHHYDAARATGRRFESPANATGLFDLDAQPELLVALRGLEPRGHFVFELPRASNSFDFDAIADVP
jgi:hypothetical protein